MSISFICLATFSPQFSKKYIMVSPKVTLYISLLQGAVIFFFDDRNLFLCSLLGGPETFWNLIWSQRIPGWMKSRPTEAQNKPFQPLTRALNLKHFQCGTLPLSEVKILKNSQFYTLKSSVFWSRSLESETFTHPCFSACSFYRPPRLKTKEEPSSF